MTIEIWLGISLIISIVINVFLLIFSRDISSRYYVVIDNLTDLVKLLKTYSGHLKNIYSMEMFYGDQNLENLMDHTRALMDILENDYGDLSLIESFVEYEEESEEKEEQPEQDVFYLGSRERNP